MKATDRYILSDKSKSDLYTDFLPILNSRKIDLLDNDRLITQIASLERRTGRLKDVIDHPPGGHDDLVNAVAGAAHLALVKYQHMATSVYAPIFIPLERDIG